MPCRSSTSPCSMRAMAGLAKLIRPSRSSTRMPSEAFSSTEALKARALSSCWLSMSSSWRWRSCSSSALILCLSTLGSKGLRMKSTAPMA
ncbi:hypothetical protein D3C78_1559560 [compost metagenome]